MAVSGTIFNCGLIVFGSLAGLCFKKLLDERVRNTLMQAIGLIVIFVGISGAVSASLTQTDGAFGTQYTLQMILAMVFGTLIGEGVDLEALLDRFGAFCQRKLSKKEGDSGLAEGMVTASLIFVVGAMAVVGSLDNGIRGDNSVLVAKGVIDGITSAVLASTLGIGVMLSVLPVFVYQGAISLLGVYIEPYLTDAVIAQMSFVGSVLIFAIGVKMLTGMKLRVGNMLPAIFMPILFDLILRLFA